MSGWAHNFDLTNGVNILRLICGLFFIPHIVGKYTEPATLNDPAPTPKSVDLQRYGGGVTFPWEHPPIT